MFFDKIGRNTRFWRFISGKELHFKMFGKEFNVHTINLISGLLLILVGILLLTGSVFVFNKYIQTTGFQKWILGLEDKLMMFLNKN